MQKINYSEKIKLKSKINELIMINIDDKLEQTIDSDCLKISGIVQISGEANTETENESFLHQIDVDIILGKEQLIEDRVKILIDDFDYSIEEEFIIINLIMKIDGIKEIEAYFPPQEDQEDIEVITQENIIIERNDETETHEDSIPQICNDSEELIIEDNPPTEEAEITIEEPIEPPKEKFSLLEQVFRNKTIKKEPIYKLHVVKTETSYQEIAELYNVEFDTLKKANNDEEIYIGKLIFIPIK